MGTVLTAHVPGYLSWLEYSSHIVAILLIIGGVIQAAARVWWVLRQSGSTGAVIVEAQGRRDIRNAFFLSGVYIILGLALCCPRW